MAFSLVACNRGRAVPESLAGIRDVVAQLDSSVTAIYGWEPQDSTYNRSVDTAVARAMVLYAAATSEQEAKEKGDALSQAAYDQARGTWTAFRRLCDADRYEEALDFYLGENSQGEKNSGDFLVFLKHSSQRYAFFSKVLFPLLREYREDRAAVDQYLGVLEFERLLEEAAIAMQAEGNGYVPEVYPFVLRDLGYCLAAAGRMDEAEDMFDAIVSGVYSLQGDELYAFYCGTGYLARLYFQSGRKDLAEEAWWDLRDHILESGNRYDNINASDCLMKIMEEIDAMGKGSPSFDEAVVKNP
jgi:tetratricopeptide (TPR) repeat protein